MSYCRWSDMDWRCDIYAYADVSGGYTIHVAGNRVKGDIPAAPFEAGGGDAAVKAFLDAHRKQTDFLKTAEREPIDHPLAGEHYNLATLQEFKAKLLELRAAGFHFPDYVLEEIETDLYVARHD